MTVIKPLRQKELIDLLDKGFSHWIARQFPKSPHGGLLIVEPDEEFREVLMQGLAQYEYPIWAVATDAEAIEICQQRDIGVILADLDPAINLINDKYIQSRQMIGTDLAVMAMANRHTSTMFTPFNAEILKPIKIENLHIEIIKCFDDCHRLTINHTLYKWKKAQWA